VRLPDPEDSRDIHDFSGAARARLWDREPAVYLMVAVIQNQIENYYLKRDAK
jgi:hypothetical protein